MARIEAFGSKSLQEIVNELFLEEGFRVISEWSEDLEFTQHCVLEDTSGIDSAAVIDIKWWEGKLNSINIVTAWSQFEYYVRDWATGEVSSKIEYKGAVKGFNTQNLLPDLGTVRIQKIWGEYASCYRPDGNPLWEQFRELVHNGIKETISPLLLEDLRIDGSQAMKERLGLTYRNYKVPGQNWSGFDGWTNEATHQKILELLK